MKFYSIFKEVVSKKAYAMARTFSEDPLQAFKFRVNISGVNSQIGFQSVGGISRETEVVTYLENMFDYEHKLPGRETVGEITFARGMYADTTYIDAYKDIFRNGAVRRDVTISICDRFNNIRKTFQCSECWFSKYEVADLDATSSDVLIETLTMQFESFL